MYKTEESNKTALINS